MYLISWTDYGKTGVQTLKVHTLRAAREVVSTLEAQPHRMSNVGMTYTRPNRVREIVITFER